MKLKSIAAAAVLAACGLAAQAQTPAAPPMHDGKMHEQMHEHMQKRMQERSQRRMDSFKRILQITPNQDGAWNTWTAAMRPSHAAMQQRHHAREEFARMSTPERIDRMRQMRAQRNAEMDRRADATKALYAQLTPPQQKAFDEVSMKFLHRARGHRGGHHGM
ncbi:MAG TPA: Spy/CpxP family protein refolding chaperone [Ramlibacter sp.]|nr:Spy/CpxP family protein refolding chaperone [Ramlibacter sp.]